MPGHIKKTDGPDPDPSPWLIVSDDLKVKLKSKPYDPKKSCWVPDKATGGYDEGLIESADGDKISVKLLKGDTKVFKKDQVQQVNPPKFDCTEDMANLTRREPNLCICAFTITIISFTIIIDHEYHRCHRHSSSSSSSL